MSTAPPEAHDAFGQLLQNDRDAARTTIAGVATDELLSIEWLCVALIWICRDERAQRQKEARG